MSLRYCMERNQRCIKGADGEVKATTSCWWNAEAKTFVLNSVLFSEFSRWIIIWLCVTGTGNYRIHKFDWLKSILTAPSHVDGLHFAAKRSKTKIKKYWLFFHGSAKRPNEKKKWRGQANWNRFRFSSSPFASKIAALAWMLLHIPSNSITKMHDIYQTKKFGVSLWKGYKVLTYHTVTVKLMNMISIYAKFMPK